MFKWIVLFMQPAFIQLCVSQSGECQPSLSGHDHFQLWPVILGAPHQTGLKRAVRRSKYLQHTTEADGSKTRNISFGMSTDRSDPFHLFCVAFPPFWRQGRSLLWTPLQDPGAVQGSDQCFSLPWFALRLLCMHG